MSNQDDAHNEMQNQWRPVPWKPLDIGLAAAAILIAILALVIVVSFAGPSELDELAAVNPFYAFLQEGFLILVVWFFAIRKYRVNWKAFGLRLTSSSLSLRLPALAVVLMVSITVVYSLIVQNLGIDILIPPPLEERGIILGEGIRQFANIGIIALWGPFAEEILFRGFILAGLVSWLGGFRAAIVSAGLFALAHVFIYSLIPIFIIGLILAWLYLRTRSLWPPIIAHSIWNLLVVAITLFAEGQPIATT